MPVNRLRRLSLLFTASFAVNRSLGSRQNLKSLVRFLGHRPGRRSREDNINMEGRKVVKALKPSVTSAIGCAWTSSLHSKKSTETKCLPIPGPIMPNMDVMFLNYQGCPDSCCLLKFCRCEDLGGIWRFSVQSSTGGKSLGISYYLQKLLKVDFTIDIALGARFALCRDLEAFQAN